jgi:hypothetical protein
VGQALFETDREAWHHAAIVGHTNASKLFPFTREEGRVLQEWDVIVVSQLFGINELTGRLDKTENLMLAQRLLRFPLLQHKLQLLRNQLLTKNFTDKTSVAVTTLALLFRKDQNISQNSKELLNTTCTCP